MNDRHSEGSVDQWLPLLQALGSGQSSDVPVHMGELAISVQQPDLLCISPKVRRIDASLLRRFLRAQFESAEQYQTVQIGVNHQGQLCLLVPMPANATLTVSRLSEVLSPALDLLRLSGIFK
jgi:hypothetical protein